MKLGQTTITLTFRDYDQSPDRSFDEERCLHTSDDRWFTAEEMNDESLFPALQQMFARMKRGDTLHIQVQIQPSESSRDASA